MISRNLRHKDNANLHKSIYCVSEKLSGAIDPTWSLPIEHFNNFLFESVIGSAKTKEQTIFSILSRFIWIRCQIVLYLVLASILFSSFITGFYFISNVKDIEDKANFQKSVNRLISPLDHTWKRRRSCNRKVIFCGLSKLLTHFHWVCVVILRNLSLAICRWPGR